MHTTISTLNLLIETCNDGVKGYDSAADVINNPQYRHLFNQFSQQRLRFATTLSRFVKQYGGQPERGDTLLLAVLHRNWLNLRAFFSFNRTRAILDECERGESVALNNYRRALSDELPEAILAIVREQFSIVQSTHRRIRALRDLTS